MKIITAWTNNVFSIRFGHGNGPNETFLYTGSYGKKSMSPLPTHPSYKHSSGRPVEQMRETP